MTSVLVVDDSQLVRSQVGSVLTDHGYEVGTASDGTEAVELVELCDPDVVTMDVRMPGMDGIAAVEEIMATNPTPIVMLSAHTGKGAQETIRALARGAVDFLRKPGGETDVDMADLETELLETVDAVAGAPEEALVVRAEAATTDDDGSTTESPPAPGDPVGGAGSDDGAGSDGKLTSELPEDFDVESSGVPDSPPTVVIGASTGGPKVVNGILSELPVELGARVLVVQHMPEAFTRRMADHLDAVSDYDVSEATVKDSVGPGECLVAKGDHHMRVTGEEGDHLQVTIDQGRRLHSVRPSADATMTSVAYPTFRPLVAVVLTGMGKDGAAGLEAMKEAGATTIAQDESTSPVYSMPRNAIETGCVDHVLPAGGIASAIVDAAGQPEREEAHA